MRVLIFAVRAVLAPVFTPASTAVTSPVVTSETAVVQQSETVVIESVHSTTTTTTTTTTTSVSVVSSSTESSSASSHGEPESEELQEPSDSEEETAKQPQEAEDAIAHQVEESEADAVAVAAVSVVATDSTEEQDAIVEAQQTVIGQRILYTIAQLLEMEPETCPIPPSVVGLIVATDKPSKASAISSANKEEHGGSSRGGSRRGERKGESGRGNGGRRERGGRGGRGGGRGGYHAQHDTAPALEDCVPLQINEETRWKPSHVKSKLDAPVDKSVTESSLREAKAILNKLSIEKFEKLSNQLIEVAVRELDVLKGVIEMVIQKAQMEWHFSTMYAELCSKMAMTAMPALSLPPTGDEEEDLQPLDTHKLFRKLLLDRCQKEFEVTPSKDGLEELPEDARLEKELLLKRATLGHIRFVGELYKQRMLSSRIMHYCVGRLFGDVTKADEESLECLCKLLSTIGRTLETSAKHPGELEAIGQFYSQIKALSKQSDLLCTRVRFMLQDLLELRKNRWVARREETKAMTIAEVHAEAAREAKEKAKSSAAPSGNARLQRSQSAMFPSSSSSGSLNGDRRRGNSASASGGASAAWKARAAAAIGGAAPSVSTSSSSETTKSVDADGWETVTVGRPKLVKSRSNSDRPLSTASPSSAGLPRAPSSRNAFASLRQEKESNGSRRKDRSASSSSSPGGSMLRRASSSSSISSTDAPSRPPLSSNSSPKKSEDKPAATTEALSSVDFEKKCKSILAEFVELRDMAEAVTCLKELASQEHHALLVTQSLNLGLDKGNKEREAMAALLAGLVEQEVVTVEHFNASMLDLLEFVEDLEIDIPLTLSYLSEMLAPSVQAGGVDLTQLIASVQHLIENGKAAKLVGRTLSAVKDQEKTKQLVLNVDLKSVLPKADRHDEGMQAFYSQWTLEFLAEA